MARLKNGILGGFSGKIGPVVGYKWLGKDCMRSMPRITDKPPTPNQKASQTKFGMVSDWLKPISDFVKMNFKAYRPDITGLMAAQSYNVLNGVKGKSPNFEIDFASVRLSIGHLPGGYGAKVVSEEPATLSISWDRDPGEDKGKHSDQLMYLAYFPSEGYYMHDMSRAFRGDMGFDVKLPKSYSGQIAEVYICFSAMDRTDISTSQYLGQVLIA